MRALHKTACFLLAFSMPCLAWADQPWCTRPVHIGAEKLVLGQTSQEDIGRIFGPAPQFQWADSALPSVCYRWGDIFMTIAFSAGDGQKMAGASISALPPADGQEDFCPTLSDRPRLQLNGEFIGKKKSVAAGKMLHHWQKMDLLGRRGDFQCHFMQDATVFHGRIIYYAVGLAQSN